MLSERQQRQIKLAMLESMSMAVAYINDETVIPPWAYMECKVLLLMEKHKEWVEMFELLFKGIHYSLG